MGCGTKQLEETPQAIEYLGYNEQLQGHMFLRQGKPFLCTHVWRDDGQIFVGCMHDNKEPITCTMTTIEEGYLTNCRPTKPEVGF